MFLKPFREESFIDSLNNSSLCTLVKTSLEIIENSEF